MLARVLGFVPSRSASCLLKLKPDALFCVDSGRDRSFEKNYGNIPLYPKKGPSFLMYMAKGYMFVSQGFSPHPHANLHIGLRMVRSPVVKNGEFLCEL